MFILIYFCFIIDFLNYFNCLNYHHPNITIKYIFHYNLQHLELSPIITILSILNNFNVRQALIIYCKTVEIRIFKINFNFKAFITIRSRTLFININYIINNLMVTIIIVMKFINFTINFIDFFEIK